MPDRELPHVIIIGGGFAGLAAARTLAASPVRVTVIDRTNHHLFQPLLYQVATAGLSPGHIAQPIRSILSGAKNITVLLADVRRIDPAARQVVTAEAVLDYDQLIIAAGARHSYFGHDEWEKFAPGLKTIPDAVEIRRRLLSALELAERTTDPAERAAAMTFVVVGAGPTGVEMAGAIAELARFTPRRDFRQIDPTDARVILLDALPRVLPTFHEELSEKAARTLRRMRIDVRTGEKVQTVTAESVELESGSIPTRTIIWAAGNAASPLGRTLGVPLDKAGRVLVGENLGVPGHPEIQVLGDMAAFLHQTGEPLPGIAPAAMQMGKHAGENVIRALDGHPGAPFHYLDKGSMATIGRNHAVADLHILRFNGFLAWLAWLVIHLAFLVGFRNRLAVFAHWVWAYFTFSKGARLISDRASTSERE